MAETTTIYRVHVHLTAVYDPTAVLKFIASAEKLKSRANIERALHQGIRKAGDKTRTVVRHALKAQTGVKRYGDIVEKTRSYIPAPLTYVIEGAGSGLPIEKFKVNVHAFDPDRWSARAHWKVQPRNARGRFGPIDTRDDDAVEGFPWAVSHHFKRSYVAADGSYRAFLPGRKRGKGRMLFGPAIWKEIVKDQSLAAFTTSAPKFMDEEVMREARHLMP